EGSYGEHKSLLQSSLYFLHFGAYAAYPNSNSIPAFETFDWSGALSFFKAHWKPYSLWIVIVAIAVTLRRSRARDTATDDPAENKAWLFRQRLCVVLFSTIPLSIVWGYIQEGPMFYFNSLFNFAIYYVGLLIVALTCALWVQKRVCQWPARLSLAARLALGLAVAVAFGHEAPRFRGALPDQAEEARFATSIEEALKFDPVEPKFVTFDWQAGGQTTRLALYLERHGRRWLVREDWPLLFGQDRIARENDPSQPTPTLASSFWRVVPHSSSATLLTDPKVRVFALPREYDLIVHRGQPRS
ncbi:MAG TPA: hypothetical protein VLO30_03220, partial [Chthoniobacterales bacterium]|nr:hypothetical protein [Chthoniobacterales bacterium]